MSVGELLVALSVGGVCGYWSPSDRTQRAGDGIIIVGLVVLLSAIGAQLGANDQVLQDLNTIGGSALVLCLGSVIGSIICVYLSTVLFSVVSSSPTSKDENVILRQNRSLSEPPADGFDWQITALIFISLASGLGLSAIGIPEEFLTGLASTSDYALLALLFGVGVTVGSDTDTLSNITQIKWRVLLIPLFVAGGSILGGVLLGMIIGIPIIQSAAVAAGFGWYSYAGVIMFDLAGGELAAIAFLANLFREIITFFILPATAKYLGGTTSIAPGGATTMDVTLPLIQRVSGEKFVIPALVNGIVLSVGATVLIPAILGL